MRRTILSQWWCLMARSDWRRPELTPLEDGYKRVKLTVSYDGSAFNGWQCQSNGVGVQDVINDMLSRIYGCRIMVQGSGRTDSGVHALCQVCHYDVRIEASSIKDEKVAPALNALLPLSIRVIRSESADGSFHARFTTMAREYRYFVKARNEALPFDHNYVALYNRLPDLELLNSYACLLKGTHDFTTFASSRDESPSKKRDIYESYWSLVHDKFGNPLYCYTVTGNAFLYHQVRSMVGTMMVMALKGESPESFREVLVSCDRKLAKTTAPSAGLYLSRISYDEDEYRWFEEGKDGPCETSLAFHG